MKRKTPSKKLTKRQKQSVDKFVQLQVGMTAVAMLTAGAQVLEEHFDFTEEQQNEWYKLAYDRMLANAELVPEVLRRQNDAT